MNANNQSTLILFLLLSLLFNPKISNAGIDGQLRHWFSQQNYNVTRPGAYEGQGARFATFGGLSMRTPVSAPMRLVDVQTPKFSAGCAGIDYYAGGFKAIDAKQFIENLRHIGQNAQSLAFMLAIQIVSPQLSAVMENIQNWANKYLTMNLDSCQAATQMVGGTMDFFGAKAGNCTVKRMQDYGEDWTVANHNCTTGGQVKNTENDQDPNKVEFVKGNLAWSVLMHDHFFQNDREFSELIMNITGTIIISDGASAPTDDGPSRFQIIDPAISDHLSKERYQNIVKNLLHGRQASDPLSFYRCQDPIMTPKGCLILSSQPEIYTDHFEGLHQKVSRIINSIIDKIYKDEPLDSSEKGLIVSTQIPLYRLLLVTTAYFPRANDIVSSIDDYITLISEDILLNAFSSVLSRVEQQIALLASSPSESKRLEKFKINVQKSLQGIAFQSKTNRENTQRFFEMHQRIQLYEKALMSRLSSNIIANAFWGR